LFATTSAATAFRYEPADMNSNDIGTNSSTEARRIMIEQQIKSRGVRDERVLEAMAAVPRERFVTNERVNEAYDDRALPIAEHQTISQPFIVAYMTEALKVSRCHTVLEIGTGSGYQTAILARLAESVHTVERVESLAGSAARRLATLGITDVMFHLGDGSVGWPENAPYDRILVTAAAPGVPQSLVNQLAEDGVLVMPVGGLDRQTIVSVTRRSPRIIEESLIGCRFVKLVGVEGWR